MPEGVLLDRESWAGWGQGWGRGSDRRAGVRFTCAGSEWTHCPTGAA